MRGEERLMRRKILVLGGGEQGLRRIERIRVLLKNVQWMRINLCQVN